MYPADFNTCHVTVNDIQLAYQEAGRGEPLVCVHGNFAGKRWFTEQLQRPPAGTQVIALDLPNFAGSEAMPEPISIGAYADYLHGFLDALGLERVVLLGHSLGGAVAQMLAARSPHRLRGLILLSSAPPNGLKTPEAHYPVLESLKGNVELMAQALAPTMSGRRPEYFEALTRDALKMNPTAFGENARALERYNLTAELQNVGCPVLVIRGEHDYLVSEEMAQETARAFPDARLELLKGIGHSPQLEDPARFERILDSFLEGLP